MKYEPNTKDLIGHYAVMNFMRNSSIKLPAAIKIRILKLISVRFIRLALVNECPFII